MSASPQPSIALILPFFGPWPDWMPAFLVTCAWNPDVDWHFFSDTPAPAAHPDNVFFHRSTLDRIAARAADALGFPVHLQRAYKLCDLKPAYGLMFPDHLEPYDFWGHCDPDILWGDIRRFMTPRRLGRFDILTSRRHALAGHFCIYRNTDAVNRICRDTPGWERILNDNDTSYMLDEAGFSRLIQERTEAGEIRVFRNRTLATSGSDQKPVLLSDEPLRWRRGRPYDSAGRPVRYLHWLARGRPFTWKEGRTRNAFGREMMYLHFHRLKNSFGPCPIRFENPPDRMIIDATGIHHG